MPVYEFGGDEQLAVNLLECVGRADSGMRQGGCSAGLALEPFTPKGIADSTWRERLERNVSPKPSVGRQVHAPHAATTDFANDLVRPERPRDERLVEDGRAFTIDRSVGWGPPARRWRTRDSTSSRICQSRTPLSSSHAAGILRCLCKHALEQFMDVQPVALRHLTKPSVVKQCLRVN